MNSVFNTIFYVFLPGKCKKILLIIIKMKRQIFASIHPPTIKYLLTTKLNFDQKKKKIQVKQRADTINK